MAATDISDDKTRDEHEQAIRDMRAGRAPGKSKRKKLLFLSLGAVLLLGGGGGAAWLLFGADDAAAPVEADAPPVVEAPHRIGYINLKAIFVPIETDAGTATNVVVSLALEVDKEGDNRTKVEAALPRLYEAYLRALTARPLPGAAEGKVEVTAIKNRIRAENLRLLGPGVVYDVIVQRVWDPES